MDNLERLRTLLATASDRPWEAIVSDSPKYMSTVQFEYLNGTAGTVALVGASNLSQQNTNAELIAEGINALPGLLDEITRLTEALRQVGMIFERADESDGEKVRKAYRLVCQTLVYRARSSGKAGSDA